MSAEAKVAVGLILLFFALCFFFAIKWTIDAKREWKEAPMSMDVKTTIRGETLELYLRWAEVLVYAGQVLIEAKRETRHQPGGSDVIEMKHVALGERVIYLYFQRKIRIPNQVESVADYSLAIDHSMVEFAVTPTVWQIGIRDAVQKLRAEVPALGFLDGPL